MRGQTYSDPDATVPSSAFALSAVAAARMLAERAMTCAVAQDVASARAAIEDATVILDGVGDDSESARVAVLLGEALLAVRDARAAHEQFERAFVRLLVHDREACARSVLGIARALQMLGDTRSKHAFEYAGYLQRELS